MINFKRERAEMKSKSPMGSPVLKDDNSSEWSYGDDSFESYSSTEREKEAVDLEVNGRHVTPRVKSNESIGNAPAADEDLFGNEDNDNENIHTHDWDEDLAFLAGTGDRKENLTNALENVMRTCNINVRPRFTSFNQAQRSSSSIGNWSFASQPGMISPTPGMSYESKLWLYQNDRKQRAKFLAVRNAVNAKFSAGNLLLEQRQMNVRSTGNKPVPLPTPSVKGKHVITEAPRMAGYQRIPTPTPVDNMAQDESARHRFIPIVVASPLQRNESRLQHQESQQKDFAQRSSHLPAIHENDPNLPPGRLSQTPTRAKSSTYWNTSPIDHRPYTPSAFLLKSQCSKTSIDSDVCEASTTPRKAQPEDKTVVPSTPETGNQESKASSLLYTRDRVYLSETISEISLPTEDIIPHYDGPDGNETGTHHIQESQPICRKESWEEKKWVRLRRFRRRIQRGWSVFRRSLLCGGSKL